MSRNWWKIPRNRLKERSVVFLIYFYSESHNDGIISDGHLWCCSNITWSIDCWGIYSPIFGFHLLHSIASNQRKLIVIGDDSFGVTIFSCCCVSIVISVSKVEILFLIKELLERWLSRVVIFDCIKLDKWKRTDFSH